MVTWEVNPDTGNSPYTLSATFVDKSLLNGVDYSLEVQYALNTGSCVIWSSGFANIPLAPASLLSTGSYVVGDNTPTGDCFGFFAVITRLSDSTVIQVLSTYVDNI